VRNLEFNDEEEDGASLFSGAFRPELIQAVLAPPDSPCVNQTVHEIGQAFVAPVCRIPLLGSGESRTFTIQLAIPPDYRPQTTSPLAITSSALIVGSETHEDPTPLNNRSVVTSTITPQADVAITKLGLPAIIAGAIASYFIDVTNRGPSSATNVMVS